MDTKGHDARTLRAPAPAVTHRMMLARSGIRRCSGGARKKQILVLPSLFVFSHLSALGISLRRRARRLPLRSARASAKPTFRFRAARRVASRGAGAGPGAQLASYWPARHLSLSQRFGPFGGGLRGGVSVYQRSGHGQARPRRGTSEGREICGSRSPASSVVATGRCRGRVVVPHVRGTRHRSPGTASAVEALLWSELRGRHRARPVKSGLRPLAIPRCGG